MTRHIDTAPVLAGYQTAWQDVQDMLAALVQSPTSDRTVLNRQVGQIVRQLHMADDQARYWAELHLPAAFTAAVGRIAPGHDVRADADDLGKVIVYHLLAASVMVETSLRRLTRRMAADRQLARAEGDEKVKRARALVDRAAIAAAVYNNGARQPLDAYADMVLTTQTQVAVNRTAVTVSPASMWLLTDGPDCGLTSHDDPDKADGMVVDTDTALAYPTSHPNCTREVYPADATGVSDVDSEYTN